MISKEVFRKAENTIELLKKHNLTVASAESCTGGMVSTYITSVPGVSEVFELGITSYSCNIKNKILNVDKATLDSLGAVSEETAKQMAENVRSIAGSDLGVSVTGAAGPDGTEGHPPGYVFIAIADKNATTVKLLNIEPLSRNYVRETTVLQVFQLIEYYIKDFEK